MKESKTENISFRLTPKRKLAVMNRSLELGKQPGEYLNDLIEKDLGSKANELPPEQETFLEKQFQQFTDKLLSFFVDNYDKKLLKIERLSAQSSLTSHHVLIQSSQAAIRLKETLYGMWKEKAMVDALDVKIKERIKLIDEEIKASIEKGKY